MPEVTRSRSSPMGQRGLACHLIHTRGKEGLHRRALVYWQYHNYITQEQKTDRQQLIVFLYSHSHSHWHIKTTLSFCRFKLNETDTISTDDSLELCWLTRAWRSAHVRRCLPARPRSSAVLADSVSLGTGHVHAQFPPP